MTARAWLYFSVAAKTEMAVRGLNITKDKTYYAPPPPAPTQSTNEKMGDKAFVR